MRLKHKNTSKWAKRIVKRGLNTQDVNTRLAISEQLHKHQLLTMKQSSMGSSSDENSDTEDEYSGSDGEEAFAVLQKAKESTQRVLKEDGEAPKSGLLSLPFMVTLEMFMRGNIFMVHARCFLLNILLINIYIIIIM